jgi:uncharacterized protein (TIGR03790 family)
MFTLRVATIDVMRRTVIGFILYLLAPAGAFGLSADDLLLVVNKNVPEGRKLAEFYAAQRKVPDGRIVELDLPAGDEISFDGYEKDVFGAVRSFLAKGGLGTKVTCVVTFYGVPLRVAARANTPADVAERDACAAELKSVLAQADAGLSAVEAYARALDPKFAPGADKTIGGMMQRDRDARAAIAGVASRINDPARFEATLNRAEELVAPLIGPATMAQQRMQAMARAAAQWTPEQRREAERIRAGLVEMRGRFDALQARRGDAESRVALRALVKEQLGLFEYARLLEGMVGYFETDATDAALDSELALLHWNFYKRGGSIPNPLHYKQRATGLPPVLMTARLDGPKPETVREMIAAGVRIEAQGLSGTVVVDAGGHLAIDARNAGYVNFDKALRRLADVVRTRTALPLVFDEKRDVLAANSAKGVAVYCGWYALQNYTPPGSFVPGAVGFHVASFELTTLHNPSRQWCAGLLSDGVAATVGAVNEPFLSAFPPPDEFFPLLFTGKLTLGEAYWKTNPVVSWRVALVGDPLYAPFRAKPALAVEGLGEGLRGAVAGPPAAPGGAPGKPGG